MSNDRIIVKGARVHNLKNIDVEIPRNKLVVVTGLSGSGKSSLAFDTLYAEGQRRYVESLSAYARQFLGLMDKPDVDHIDGLSPAISIDQKTTSRNPRSTVGTVTEVYDYLRLLYARIGIPHCPRCHREISQTTVDQMVDTVMALGDGARIQLLAPLVRGRKGEHVKLLDKACKEGYVRIRVDGEMRELAEEIVLDKNKSHTLEVVVDRLVVRPGVEQRLADSLETVLALGEGLAVIDVIGGEELLFSQNYACPDCGISIEELTPRMFSFNSPFGACERCAGLGVLMEIDPYCVIPDRSLSLAQGAISAPGWNVANGDSTARMFFEALGARYGFSLDVPVSQLADEVLDVILYGTRGEKLKVNYNRESGSGSFVSPFEGIIPNLQRRYNETQSEYSREEIEALMSYKPCPECRGARLKPEVLAVTVGGKNINEVTDMPIHEILDFFNDLNLSEKHRLIADQILKEVKARLKFLVDVGLDYLTLSRQAGTLSGGEAQRIRLATQIGSGLTGVLYILDEPSIGLHQRDNARLVNTLKSLRDLGNTLVVVEHDEETMLASDYLIDIGPGAGVHGGTVVAAGTPEEVMLSEASITGQYLSGKKRIEIPSARRKPNGKWLTVKGASENNLKHIDVSIPLGLITCVTGVSGSGKSTLVNEILYKALARELNGSHTRPGRYEGLAGTEHLDKVIAIDQSPIGRTPRSNPATYTGVFDSIRDVFAMTNEAKIRGYKLGRFSFNVKGGRCEACRGDGIIKIEMHFLPDVYVPCEVCKGKRYNRETLEVRYKGKNIADVLDMTVEAALDFFANIPRIQRKIQTLYDVGLGYMKLGQPSTTLSGGEAQRVKLATELSRRSTGKTLYILDEPTTGLHTADVHRLIGILQRLAEGGNTIVIIEHNLDVIKTADYIVDLGPEGGDKGGQVIATGTPEEVAAAEGSYTGYFLKKILERGY
ncbi:MAG TPA: excinuclease ABC subunit UvrA [Candidatus Atribacteria bacterium]|nr:excinuclease ABC subunit UvrA [Candidatus Atribacteria bacterium]